jgi:hypothetical protein
MLTVHYSHAYCTGYTQQDSIIRILTCVGCRGGVCYDPVSATTQMQRCARRTAVRDLAAVQGLVSQLLSYDAVTFLSRLEGLRLSEAGSSIWLYHEAAHVLFEQASDMQV